MPQFPLHQPINHEYATLSFSSRMILHLPFYFGWNGNWSLRSKYLFSTCIFNNRFLVFGLELISSLIGTSFIVHAQFIQYLLQELLQKEKGRKSTFPNVKIKSTYSSVNIKKSRNELIDQKIVLRTQTDYIIWTSKLYINT